MRVYVCVGGGGVVVVWVFVFFFNVDTATFIPSVSDKTFISSRCLLFRVSGSIPAGFWRSE